MTSCTVPGCTRLARARGLCVAHHRQALRGGPLRPLREPSEPLLRVSLRVPAQVRERVIADPAGARGALGAWVKGRSM